MANANAAAHALDTYCLKQGKFTQYASKQAMVTDLITDLLHLLEEHQNAPHHANPQAAATTALDRFVQQKK